ncbi:MAG: electron transport complex subunit RsxA [Defluviitaleaceae bacterium]|nr:electron transport complex subunit RsxA [Defluviitaleaceae bacterium]
MEFILVFTGAALVNNFVLTRFLGICPFLGVSKRVETAFGMGLAVTFVMALSSAATHLMYRYVLIPLNAEYLFNIAFVLIIAVLVQLVEMYMKKASPSLYKALGIFLPLITTNCAVLGVTLINKDTHAHEFLISVVHGVGAAVGFTLAIVLFAGIREKIEYSNIPAAFKGLPIALIASGLMSIAFLGFAGLIMP